MDTSRKKIAMVDDDLTILNIGKNTLIEKYDIFTVPSGGKLFRLLELTTPDLILLDVEMPEMNGYEIIKILKSGEKTSQIPVIFLTARSDAGNELEGLTLGAIDYITKPFSPSLLLKRIEVHMLVESQKKELKHHNDNLELIVREKTKAVLELQSATLKTIAELVECRDDVTGGHIERTQGYLKIMTEFLKEDKAYRDEVATWDINFFILSALLHDVGKIAIKDNILLKPGRLTSDEFEEMKNHTVLGAQIIQKIKKSTHENEFLRYAEILAGSHHEKWDGTGYPLGLSGENIPLQGRIMAIIDVYDALTNDRPYKKAMTHEEAVKIIEEESGTHFDPGLAKIFLDHENEFKDVDLSGSIFTDLTKENEETASEFREMVSSTVAEIVSIRDGVADKSVEMMQSYIRIFLEALIKREKFSESVSSWDFDLFLLSAKLHDFGKITIRDDILQKPSKLTREEFSIAKQHAGTGAKLIQMIKTGTEDDEFLEQAESIAGSHHEKWDGTGYPHGLSGNAIPLQGRVMAIIDVYCALTGDRYHKKAIPHEEAVKIIENGRGSHFDPDLVDIFLEHESEFKRARDEILCMPKDSYL